MNNTCTIIAYHYVRDLPQTDYPDIKGLLISEFEEQLDYLSKYYTFITIEDCMASVYDKIALPSNSVLLTFDDGYVDHYDTVFPILQKQGIQGCFFPPGKAIVENEILDVNKIHFILASFKDKKSLVNVIFSQLDHYRLAFNLESNEHYYSKLAKKGRFDSKEIMFVKRLLQVDLDEELRTMIINNIFTKYVTSDTKEFSKNLYMSIENIKEMQKNGMFIGSHGYNHYWLDSLSSEDQENEIDKSLDFLSQITDLDEGWVMCYPYGAYDNSLINILKEKGCKLAFTTKGNLSKLSESECFEIERLDTNDIPKVHNAEPNFWTKKIIDR
tara:strand:+ start:34 stop:1017 length:984 start_codon:yes stop_codon:yes gene_type:complete